MTKVAIELAVGYMGGHWEQVTIEVARSTAEKLASDDCLADLLPEYIQQRPDVKFVHLLYVGEAEEDDQERCEHTGMTRDELVSLCGATEEVDGASCYVIE